MKVMVTGGTGFVGSHTVVELIKNGHEVKLLVRSLDRVAPALEPLGIKANDVEAVKGDVLERASVERAAEGCEATVHCGSVYTMDPRAAKTIKRTNVTGTRTVVETAHRLGHDPIIHVSSVVALMGVKGCVLTSESEPMITKGVYPISKAESDLVARDFQKKGAPVVITYPGSVWGPNDPHFGESCQIMRNILKGFWMIGIAGRLAISDVRDIARLHALLMEKGRGPRRYLATACNVTMKELLAEIYAITGRKLPNFTLPAWPVIKSMEAMDALQLILPFRLPYNFQSVYAVSCDNPYDDAATRKDFGVEPLPLKETLADTMRWMVRQGYLPLKLVGKLEV
jgi:dihydroflavonol-4-reductase